MKRILIDEALINTSPHPVSLVCAQAPDGITNLTAVSWWTYLEKEPPLIGFLLAKSSYTGELVAKSGKAVLSIPGEAISTQTHQCGRVCGRDVNKAERFGIALMREGAFQFPVHSRFAFICTLTQQVDVGGSVFYICKMDEMFYNENERQTYAWGGSQKVAPLP